MKKFELKEVIKAEIKSILSEDLNEDRKAIEYIKSIKDPEERKAEIKRIFGDDYVNETKYRVEYTTQDGENAKSQLYDSEEKANEKEEKLVNSGVNKSKVVKVEEPINETEISDLDKVKAEIKKHLAMYQDAEGDMAKKSAVEMLKKLNVEKKRLEAEEIEKASSIGMDQELDYDA